MSKKNGNRRPRRKPDSRRVAAAPDRRATWIVCACLTLAVGAVFGQTVRHDFLDLDDDVLHSRESLGRRRIDAPRRRLGVYQRV